MRIPVFFLLLAIVCILTVYLSPQKKPTERVTSFLLLKSLQSRIRTVLPANAKIGFLPVGVADDQILFEMRWTLLPVTVERILMTHPFEQDTLLLMGRGPVFDSTAAALTSQAISILEYSDQEYKYHLICNKPTGHG